MAKGNKAVSRTAKKIIINLEQARTLISDVEIEVLENIVKRIENIDYFLKQKAGK